MRTIRIESFEETNARAMERARQLDCGEHVEPEHSLIFETIEDMLECLSKERIRVCRAVRGKSFTMSALAQELGRDRRAVGRDVKRLAELHLVSVRKEKNPGHGQVAVIEAPAEKLRLLAEF